MPKDSSVETLSLIHIYILENPQVVIEFQHKAFDVGRKYHLQENITRDLIQDFESIENTKNL